MYKRTSFRHGGAKPQSHKSNVQRSRRHGNIVVRMIGGQIIDPPITIPGNSSYSVKCDFCHQIFLATPDTPVILLDEFHVFRHDESRRMYRMFCSINHADEWQDEREMVRNQ